MKIQIHLFMAFMIICISILQGSKLPEQKEAQTQSDAARHKADSKRIKELEYGYRHPLILPYCAPPFCE
ncbi:hypothetical protein O181_102786 [Austropuccinia psidii MF-1]|uniref:Uncharacterized protein n=1 Tax=Austropuccinia psidii MF-1 TaxID=1389203 RepID=A0A9Q3JJD6_9BASI|nr:hypothetical protein [Austropuccinia psidii MF-1]